MTASAVVSRQCFLVSPAEFCDRSAVIFDADSSLANSHKYRLMGFYAIALFQQTLFTSIYVKFKYQ